VFTLHGLKEILPRVVLLIEPDRRPGIVCQPPLPDGAVEDGLQQLQMVVHSGDGADLGQGCLEVLHVLRSDVARKTLAERTSKALSPRPVVAVRPFAPPAVVQIVGQDLVEENRPGP
jgi:hypothetical protein